MTPAVRNWHGSAEREALALHCSMGSSAYWAPIAEYLADEMTITAVDAPGHGRNSDWLPSAEGPDFHRLYTQWAMAQITRPVHLIGHSLGATVALRIAVDRPDLVSSLTLIEPVLFAAAPQWLSDPIFAEVERHLAAGQDEAAARAFVDAWGAPGGFDGQPAERRARMVRQVRLVADSNKVLVEDRPGILRPGGIEAIPALGHVIYGDATQPSIRDVSEALLARLSRPLTSIVAGGGHMLPLTHPGEVGYLIEHSVWSA